MDHDLDDIFNQLEAVCESEESTPCVRPDDSQHGMSRWEQTAAEFSRKLDAGHKIPWTPDGLALVRSLFTQCFEGPGMRMESHDVRFNSDVPQVLAAAHDGFECATLYMTEWERRSVYVEITKVDQAQLQAVHVVFDVSKYAQKQP